MVESASLTPLEGLCENCKSLSISRIPLRFNALLMNVLIVRITKMVVLRFVRNGPHFLKIDKGQRSVIAVAVARLSGFNR